MHEFNETLPRCCSMCGEPKSPILPDGEGGWDCLDCHLTILVSIASTSTELSREQAADRMMESYSDLTKGLSEAQKLCPLMNELLSQSAQIHELYEQVQTAKVKQSNDPSAELISMDVWQDFDSNGDHSIQGNAAGLKALVAAISTVLEKKGTLTTGVNTKDGRVTVELVERPAKTEDQGFTMDRRHAAALALVGR